MFRSTRVTTRRRASLLATSSFVAASVLASVGAIGVTAFPSVAMAASECGTAPGILVCNPPDKAYPNGITYTGANPSAGATTLQLNESQVTQAGPGVNGVTLTATTGVNLAVLTVLQNKGDPAVNVAGTANGSGILVSSTGGDVSVGTVDLFLGDGTHDDETNNISGGNGITTSTSGAGKSTITIGADNISGTSNGSGTGAAVSATTSGSGAVSVTTLAGSNVTGGEIVVATVHAVGINATSTGGSNVGVTVGGAVSTIDPFEGNGTGVNASTTGLGTVNVTVQAGGSVFGNAFLGQGQGIVTAAVDGLTTIDSSGAVTTASVNSQIGIIATSTGTTGGEIDITTHAGGTITTAGQFNSAIQAATAGGKININVGDTLDTTNGFEQEGVNAQVGAGGANGDLDVTLNKTITTSGTGLDLTNNGTGNINVTTNKGFDISTLTGDGIDAAATGGGSVRVNLLDGAIRANTSGSSLKPAPAQNLSAVGAGQVVINAQDIQNNISGIGDETNTVNGTNYVGISATLTNSGGDGINAQSSGSGSVIVSGYNPADKTTVFTAAADGFTTGQVVGGGTTGAQGVSANINTDTGSNIVAIANGTGNVLVRTIAGGTLTNTGTAADGVVALTDFANASGSINVHIGDSIGATGNLFAGTELIGTKSGAVDTSATGVLAFILDASSTQAATVTVGTDVADDAPDIVIKAGSVGIDVANFGSGVSSVVLGNNVTIDPADFGVVMQGGGQQLLTTGATDSVTVTATGVIGAPSHVGLFADSTSATDPLGGHSVDIEVGANNTITMNGDVAGAGSGADGATGILGQNTDNGGAGSVKIATAAGLDLTITGDNVIGVLAQTADTNTFFTPSNTFSTSGSATINVGAGSITLNAGDGTDSENAYEASIGELAFTSSGNATVTNAANITVTNTAANGVGENAGISAFVQTGGAGSNASVTNTGIVIDNSGLGIQAENDGAGKATVLNNGPVTSTGADGIEAFTFGAGTADVNGSGSVTVKAGGPGAGINVFSVAGNETVGDLGSGYTGAIDNKNGGNGIQAQITNGASTGNISVTTGVGAKIGTAAGDNTLNGIIATTVGLGSVTVAAGDNIGSLTNNRVTADGIDAEINNAANLNNLSVTTGGTVSIASVGDGVFATSNGLGNVAVTQLAGTGTINSSTGVGIHATDTAGKGTGTVTVSTSGHVTTLANTAVIATSNTNGDVTVDQGATGVISATGGDGIDASETGGKNGNVSVDLKGSTQATGVGVFATTNTNDDVTVTVENGAFVQGGFGASFAGTAGDGILATNTSGKDGQVTVNLLGNAIVGLNLNPDVVGGNGVEVNSNGQGAIAVNTDVGTQINAFSGGIIADENYAGPGHSADLVITANGSVETDGVGIDAEVTSATNNAAINVTAGNVQAFDTGNGITAKTIGGGNVTVTTNAGGFVFSGGGDGINASSSGGNGNVEVINNGTVEGDPGIVITAVGTGTATEIANASVTGTHDAVQISSVDGLLTVQVNNAGTVVSSTSDGDGIDATTSGKGSISITTGAGTTVEGGNTGAKANGIFAKVGGSGTITVEVAGAVGTLAPATSDGILATGNGGLVSITLDPTGSVTDGGINATNVTTALGNGNINVALNGTSTVNNSVNNAIQLLTGTGTINVQGAAGTDITAANGDGILAGAASGAVTINDQGVIGAGQDAIDAATNSGAISVTTGPGAITGGTNGIVTNIQTGAASTTITTGLGLVTGTAVDGIQAITVGTGNITVTTGPVTGKTGISTSTNGAGVTNITTTGTVTGTGLDGIDATDNAGSGSITITTAAVSAVGGTDIAASSTGGANIIVTTNGALTGAAGVKAATNLGGSVNVHTKSTVAATGGLGVSAVAGTGGSTVTTDGLVTGVGGILASSTGAGSTQVTVNGGVDGTTGAGGIGVNASSATGNVTVAANGGAADTIKGTTGVSTNTGGAGITTITTTGLVTGTTADGIDATTTGSGLITVDTGAVTAAAGTGIKANSTTGAANIVIDATGAVNGLAGISANNSGGAGSINITDLAVTSTGGIGINATAGSGGVIVTANGPVNATGGAGINATAALGGTVQVITGAAGSVTSTTAGGIIATGVTGPVIVTTNNTVTGATNGIAATTGGAGTINIDTTAGGLVKGNAGDGIDATDSAGQILIQTAAVTGTVNGIKATGATAPITITTNGAITGGTGEGIGAFTAGAGTIQINVLTGAVQGAVGISTTQTGSGVTNIVDSLAANTITGTNGDGIQSVNGAGTGAVNVGGGTGSRIEAAVSGTTNGIDISGAGPMNVFTDANVTGGAGWGIKAVSTAAPVTVNVTTGTIKGTATGGVGGGILAKSSATGAGAVTVTSTTTVIGLGAGSNGIDAEDTTTGNVSVADTGTSVTGANDAILAKSVGGAIVVGTTAAPITSAIGDLTTLNAGIETNNTTGTTSIVTAASATIGDGNAIYGIEANSTTGGITIASASAIGLTVGNGGVNGAGIFASSSGANTTGISITNTGAIIVDGPDPIGVANATYGIYGFNAGTGLVSVTNSGVIDPGVYGIYMQGGGPVNISNTANVTGTLTALFAKSTGGGVVTVTSNGAATQLTGTTGDGIDAFSTGAGNGAVTVGVSNAAPITSNILAGVNGVDAEGNGVVGVWTSGTINGTTGTGIIAKSTSGAVAGSTVTVSTTGAISDKAGILASTTGTDAGDTVTVTAANNITTTGGIGIEADGVNGLTSVAYKSGVITTVAGDGIRGTSTGAGGVTIVTATGTDVEADSAGKNDISAITTGASGDINVTVNGTLNNFSRAGNDGIFAQVNNAASTSNINVTLGATGQSWATNDAVEATTNGLGAITVTDSGLFSWGNANGIVATATNAADTQNVTVSVSGGGEVVGEGVGGESIKATTAGTGNVSVTVANGESIVENSGGAGSGIIATNTGTAGNVTVTTGNGTIGGPIGTDGINAQITNKTNAGTVTVTNNSAITMANGSDAGIKAISAGTGNVTINNNGVIDPAAYGMYASSGGNATINNTANVTGLTGAHADTSGAASTASVNDTNLATITGTTANGIEAFGTAGGNVTVNTSAGGNITGGTNGIDTAVTGGAGVTTVNTLTGTTATAIIVTGNGGDGVVSTSSGFGAINVTTGNVTGQGAAGNASNGIVAQSAGGGSVSVSATGNVLANSATDVVGGGFAGIFAASAGGNGNVSVTTAAPALPVGSTAVVEGGSFGVFASSAGTGSTTVTAGALDPVTATGAGTAAAPSALNGGLGPVGIDAIGGSGGGKLGAATGVTVTANSNVTAAGGRGIVTSSGNNALITIAAGVTVKGLGDATAAFGGPAADKATHAVVDVSSVTGAVTTINNSGTIESVAGPAISSYGDLAITAATTGVAGATIGGVTVNNKAGGVILGRLELQGETKSDNVIISNSGTWHTTGNNNIGTAANAETITNNSGGFIGTADNSAATLLAFGAGANTVTNAAGGVIVFGEAPLGGVISGTPATPAVTTITGTVAFNNNGTIIMGNAGGSTSASDGLIDSTLEAAGTTLGGTGLIDLDANLWSDTQSAAACASSALTAADCLVIGASAGTEGIRVTDTKAHALGAFNPIGIAIVDGATNAGANFVLNSGSTWFNPGGTNEFGGATNVLDKPGLFFYDLAYNAADKTERLIGVPKAAAFEFATVGGAANDLWYATTQTWFDRQADLRDGIDGKAVGSGPGVWLKMVGDWSQRDHNDVFTDLNKTYVFNVTYDQDTAAIIGGLDLLNVTHKNEAWVVGIDGGSVDSSIDFRASPDRFHLSGANVGGYATYMSGGLYVDGTINANLLNMQVSLPQLQTTPNPWTASDHVQSFGGQVEAGYTMPLGDMLFWEPLGIVSYANTTLSPLAVPGGVQQLGSDDSFRASLGARVGATADFQYYKVKLSITGRVWDEFSNDTLSTLIVPGGANFLNNDNLKGVFGEISGQVNLFTLGSGLSAFATGGVKFKSSYTEGTMTLGARYQF